MEEIISMSHGNGGKKTSALIEKVLLPRFNNKELNSLGDGAILDVNGRIAFSTDSFVIDPIFFNGGDIGKISVCGTVNDLLMCGSIPKYLSLSFILEEGLKLSELEKIADSISETAKKAGVKVVTGDTKVVDKGHGHKIYINTSGIGELRDGICLGRERIEKGDKVILSGSMGNHGVSILCSRNNFFETNIASDCTPLNKVTDAILKYGKSVKILRDPTRGGVGTTLNEFTEDMKFSIELFEDKLPIDSDVKTACDLLGIDPLYSANEGKVLAIVSEDAAESIISDLRKIDESCNAEIIGEVKETNSGKVILSSIYGGKRIIDKLSYDQLPRIC
ncbi:MAG: hydrogenase expression/formation protein HypE [Bacillota bacterium]|nr:hydrogenase expression/formation protein HypE [Bacillota bacterium]